MKLTVSYLKAVLLALFVAGSGRIHGQDSMFFKFDPGILTLSGFGSIKFQPSLGSISHSPQKEDYQCYNANKSLISQSPTEKNHEKYFQLACSLWELKKVREAEKMFLNIVNSNEKFYTRTYYHSSDIPGDTTTNIYGYGSSTSHYKNSACIYLTQIYIEQRKFSKALAYLEDAVKKYKTSYSCGTGYHWQQQRYQFLYASCYEGLGRNKEILDLLLPQCLERDDNIIIKAVRKLYTKPQIDRYLSQAVKSVICIPDTFRCCTINTTNYGEEDEKKDTIWYYSGTATINLFGRKVEMPRPSLEDGEKITREHFIKTFKESSFYLTLHEDNNTSYKRKRTVQQ